MDWETLFIMQKKLDTYIQENHQLQGKDLFNEKVLALLVEIGELANETRCFKFWSLKKDVDEQAILEEYVDGIHFILSLGLEKNITFDLTDISDHSFLMTEQFNRIYNSVLSFKEKPSKDHYKTLFTQYIQLGKMLGFTPDDIKKAYIEKNEVNFSRQDQGY